MLVIVALLSFGEMARRGHYHLDHGRGWDLPAPVSLDWAYPQLASARIPPVVIDVVQRLRAKEHLAVLPQARPSALEAPWVWLGLRPPPEA